MRAGEMIPAARRLELTGMPRSQAETVVCVFGCSHRVRVKWRQVFGVAKV